MRIASSYADPSEVVIDIWPEPWVLPFSIEPLGDPNRQLRMEDAGNRWPILIRRRDEQGIKSVTAALNITAATVFTPTEITGEDWERIRHDLGSGEER